MPFSRHPSSYRDPSGFLFYHDDVLYRQVNLGFKEDFDLFMNSGFYHSLVNNEMIIPHSNEEKNLTGEDQWYKTLMPEKLSYISYPCEWSFDMLKDAALLTLHLAEEAMKYNLMLKDASAYNIQLHKGKMTLIDTLSFERYEDTKPWIAYRQFCEHFLAPLLLMHHTKLPLQQLLLSYPDGIPLNTASSLLPSKTKWNLNTYLHIHLHNRINEKTNSTPQKTKAFSAGKLKNIFRSLRELVQSLQLSKRSGVWSGYYEEACLRDDYVTKKKEIIEKWLDRISIHTAVDAGANEGMFSQQLWQRDIYTISADSDHYSINNLYNRMKKENIKNLHPVIIDLSQPTPAFGVNNTERNSFLSKTSADLVLALAVIHHLAIGKNIPFESIVHMFKKLGKYLIVEFIPKEDDKVSLMLEHRKDIFEFYNKENFLHAFSKSYAILDEKEVGTSKRILFLMQPHEIQTSPISIQE